MANTEHLGILKLGADAWNEWRGRSKFTKIDLSGADLRSLNLEGFNLGPSFIPITDVEEVENLEAREVWGVDLSSARLSGTRLKNVDLRSSLLVNADLIGAKLREARLDYARLDGANLMRADLTASDLRFASLCGATFDSATLIGTNLRGCDVTGANFASASFHFVNMADLDLGSASGLENVNHFFPSEITISTLFKSHGNIPDVFLRGCGVPDTMITFAKSLVGKPIQFYSAFISYSSKDEDFAKRLHADLQARGVRVWFAPEHLKIGDSLKPVIDEAIRIYDKLMIVLSENSINSAWVRHEFKNAIEKESQRGQTVLFPIRLDNPVFDTTEQWAYDIRQRNIGDFRTWKNHDDYQKSFERLLRDLNAEPQP